MWLEDLIYNDYGCLRQWTTHHLWQINLWLTFATFRKIHLAVQVAQEIKRHVKLNQMEAVAGCSLHIYPVPETRIETYR